MAFNLREYKFEITFTRELLGSVPKDDKIYRKYVAAKGEEDGVDIDDLEGEIEDVPSGGGSGATGFLTDTRGEYLSDHVVIGFMKAAAKALRRIKGTESSKVQAYRQVLNDLVHVAEEKIYLELPEGESLSELCRSLRASTPQGERVALACSDIAPRGTKIRFTLQIVSGSEKQPAVSQTWLEEIFDYGAYLGFGQWRNAGHGRFEYKVSTDQMYQD